MITTSIILESETEGVHISPTTCNAEELGQFIQSIARICNAINKNNGGDDVEPIAFTSITNNCVRLDFATARKAFYGIAALVMFQTGMLQGNKIPVDCNRDLLKINSYLRKNNYCMKCKIGARHPAMVRGASSPLKLVQIMKTQATRTLVGQVELVGVGNNPTLHLRFKNRSLTCSISRELALSLGRRLGATVALHGDAVLVDNEVDEFAVREVLSFEYDPDVNPFDAIRVAANGVFDGVDAYAYVSEHRG